MIYTITQLREDVRREEAKDRALRAELSEVGSFVNVQVIYLYL